MNIGDKLYYLSPISSAIKEVTVSNDNKVSFNVFELNKTFRLDTLKYQSRNSYSKSIQLFTSKQALEESLEHTKLALMLGSYRFAKCNLPQLRAITRILSEQHEETTT